MLNQKKTGYSTNSGHLLVAGKKNQDTSKHYKIDQVIKLLYLNQYLHASQGLPKDGHDKW
jgi:hypothetical protein